MMSALLVGGFLNSCASGEGSDPDPKTQGGMTLVERNYLKEKAGAGLAWKTRAEEIIRQSKADGNYAKNEFRIQRAYAEVDANIQVWANAVSIDAKAGQPSAETTELQTKVENSLKTLGQAAGVEGTRGWKREVVVALVKTLFPASAPLVDRINTSLNAAEAQKLRNDFLKAHRLAPLSSLKAKQPEAAPAA